MDYVINNAGAARGSDRVPVIDLAVEDWHKVLNVNLNGPFHVTLMALKALERSERAQNSWVPWSRPSRPVHQVLLIDGCGRPDPALSRSASSAPGSHRYTTTSLRINGTRRYDMVGSSTSSTAPVVGTPIDGVDYVRPGETRHAVLGDFGLKDALGRPIS